VGSEPQRKIDGAGAWLHFALLGNVAPHSGDDDGLDAAKIVAIVLMLADHVMLALPDPWPAWGYLIGRPCVPIFAFTIAVRLSDGGPDRSARMLARLLFWGVATQPIYHALIGALSPRLNVLFTLAVGVALIHLVRTRRYIWAILLAAPLPFVSDLIDSGAIPSVAMLATALMLPRSQHAALAVMVLAAAANLSFGPGTNAWAGLATLAAAPLILLSSRLAGKVPRFPGMLFYLFYPLHLLVIWLTFGPYR